VRKSLFFGVLLLLGVALGFAGTRAWRAFHAYRRLAAPPAAAADVDQIRDFVPVEVIARRYRVPETVLLDALRNAGFVARPQQSLRQIARASGRSPAEAIRVVQEAIRSYTGPLAPEPPERRRPPFPFPGRPPPTPPSSSSSPGAGR